MAAIRGIGSSFSAQGGGVADHCVEGEVLPAYALGALKAAAATVAVPALTAAGAGARLHSSVPGRAVESDAVEGFNGRA